MTGKNLVEKTWISRYLTQSEIAKIGDVVTKAESSTSGEIVPVIVRRSSAIGHVQPLTFMMLVILFLAADLSLHENFDSITWWFIVVAGCVISWMLSWVLSGFPLWQRFLTANSDEKQQVWQRAQLEFHRNKITQTSGHTGILIFISVMERKAVVLADEGISKHYPAEIWQNLVEQLTGDLKNGNWAKGFENAIVTAGKILSDKLPAQRHERNELANNLRILE